MSHEASSGNRWEPAPARPSSGHEPADSSGAAGPTDTSHIPDHAGRATTPSATTAGSSSRPRTRRDKGVLAGLAAVFLLGGGAGGYALGHAIGPDGADAQPGQHHGPHPGPGVPGADDQGRDDGDAT